MLNFKQVSKKAEINMKLSVGDVLGHEIHRSISFTVQSFLFGVLFKLLVV